VSVLQMSVYLLSVTVPKNNVILGNAPVSALRI
jgi:hypothetical protein